MSDHGACHRSISASHTTGTSAAAAAGVETEVAPIEIFTEPWELLGVRKALGAAGVSV